MVNNIKSTGQVHSCFLYIISKELARALRKKTAFKEAETLSLSYGKTVREKQMEAERKSMTEIQGLGKTGEKGKIDTVSTTSQLKTPEL